MKTFFMALCLFASCFLHAYVPETCGIPLSYQAYGWVNFCPYHLKSDPEGCSSWVMQADPKKGKKIVLEEVQFFLFPYSSLSPKFVAESLENYGLSCIPTIPGERCDWGICKGCHKKLIRSFSCKEEVVEEACKCYRTANVTKILYKCECVDDFIDKNDKAYAEIVSKWEFCGQCACFSGYFDKNISSHFAKFKSYLTYVRENPYCSCYWSEKTCFRKKILDLICDRFWEEILKGAIKVDTDEEVTAEMLEKLKVFPQRKLLECLVHSFFYTDLKVSLMSFDRKQLFSKFGPCWLDHPVSQKEWKAFCESVLSDLRGLFLTQYKNCYKEHPHPKIHTEIKMILYEINNP